MSAARDQGPSAGSRALMTVSARRFVPAEAGVVYEFLSALPNHRLIGGRRLRLTELRPDRLGGRIEVRGPLLIRRVVRTSVVYAEPPVRWGGTAAVGARTAAAVHWELSSVRRGTMVRLSAEILQAGAYDRLLLRLGGREWLAGSFEQTLDLLARTLAGDLLGSAG